MSFAFAAVLRGHAGVLFLIGLAVALALVFVLAIPQADSDITMGTNLLSSSRLQRDAPDRVAVGINGMYGQHHWARLFEFVQCDKACQVLMTA
jgi:hypothetical protein